MARIFGIMNLDKARIHLSDNYAKRSSLENSSAALKVEAHDSRARRRRLFKLLILILSSISTQGNGGVKVLGRLGRLRHARPCA